MCVPVHLPLTESVDKEREHKDLQLFEGEKKKIRAKAEKPSLFTHSWGLFFSLCFYSLLKSSSTFKCTESPFS